MKFGIKPQLKDAATTSKVFWKNFDYIEYPAPCQKLAELEKDYDTTKTRLLPHGVLFSMTHDIPFPSSLTSKLKEQITRTKCRYFGEHIGFLNPNPKGQSLGYILPPPLNPETIKSLVTNTELLSADLGVPIALENPVMYKTPVGSTLTIADFYKDLDKALPGDTSWIVDVAHLVVACGNLNEPILDVLQVLRNSNRKIVEVHLSNFAKINGIFHDDHRSLPNSDVLNLCKFVIGNQKEEVNVTIELDLDAVNENKVVEFLFKLKSELTSQRKFTTNECDLLSRKIAAGKALLKDRHETEMRGRHRTLFRRLMAQLTPFSEEEINDAIDKCFKYQENQSFITEFFNYLLGNESKLVFPFYATSINDHLDLIGALISFVNENQELEQKTSRKGIMADHWVLSSVLTLVLLPLGFLIDFLEKQSYDWLPIFAISFTTLAITAAIGSLAWSKSFNIR